MSFEEELAEAIRADLEWEYEQMLRDEFHRGEDEYVTGIDKSKAEHLYRL